MTQAPWLEKGVETRKMQLKAAATASRLEHLLALDIHSSPAEVRQTKIICTIGPSSMDLNTLESLLEAGMDIARLNFSHGDHAYHKEAIRNIRQAVSSYSEKLGRVYSLAIAMDTKGPEIRTGLLQNGYTAEVKLKKGASIKLTTDADWEKRCTSDCVYVDYEAIAKVIKKGDHVYLDHRLISLIVKDVSEHSVMCEIENDGRLGSKKSVGLPGINLGLPAITDNDKEDIQFAVQQEVDMVFASFISRGSAVDEMRKILGKNGKLIKIITKIQNQESLDNINELIANSDGVMVARGNLGAELPLQKIFIAQKSIVAKCNMIGKPVICATDMLQSMIYALQPTAAEVSDIANAVFDGTDCIMLSAETAVGAHPVECVNMMSKICLEAEAAHYNKQTIEDLDNFMPPPQDPTMALALSAAEAAQKTYAVAIILPTNRERTVQTMSLFRPRCPIVAVTRYGSIARHLRLCRGVIPLFYIVPQEQDFSKDLDARTQFGITYGKTAGFIRPSDALILVSEWHESGSINTVRVVYASSTEGL